MFTICKFKNEITKFIKYWNLVKPNIHVEVETLDIFVMFLFYVLWKRSKEERYVS